MQLTELRNQLVDAKHTEMEQAAEAQSTTEALENQVSQLTTKQSDLLQRLRSKEEELDRTKETLQRRTEEVKETKTAQSNAENKVSCNTV